MENVRMHRETKLVTTENRINYLMSEPSHHTTVFHRNVYGYRNEENTDTYEQTCFFKSIIIRIK